MVFRDKGLGAQFHYLTPGCLQPYLDPFTDSLVSAGYTALSISNYYQSIAHFGTWMDFQRIAIGEINEMSLTAFASHRCECPGGRRHKRLSRRYVARVRRFVDYLVQQRVVSGPPADATDEYPGWLAEFRASLLSYRGLSSRTVEHYVRLVTPLLTILGDNPADYDATSVRRAIDVLAPRYSLSTIQGYTTALRAYLRFLTARGLCPSELEAAVPTIPQWRLSALPRYLVADELERLFAACDTQTSCGLRDRAILLLLGRLGLRAGDIVKMRFEDIDWAEGTLRVCGKGRREVRLPLPQEVGEALLKYVEHARPPVSIDRLFLCAQAPYRAFPSSVVVSGIVQSALRRAGIVDPPSRGANLLRHSAATAMLRQGATLEAVSVLLRHRSLDTSMHYAKVDLAMLRSVAQRWPEGAPC